MVNVGVVVQNMPPDVREQDEEYIVVRVVQGEMWYWGSFETYEDAFDVCLELSNATVLCLDC